MIMYQSNNHPKHSSKLFTWLTLMCAITLIAVSAKAEEQKNELVTKSVDIPAGPLDSALSRFARSSGIYLSFPPAITQGKVSKGIKGEYGVTEGFHELLKGSGLQLISDQKGGYFLEKVTPASANQNQTEVDINLKTIKVRAKKFKDIGPLPGLALTKEQMAGNIQSISAKEIKESHSLSLSDLLNSKLQSVNVNDYQGNPFQMDVTYRGFTASPQIGTPQGLSVYFDGVRVNEPFGDVVNWDMIPMNAISGLDVFPGSNPLFGLNTLGGSFVMKTKSGFTDAGISAEILAGSYGRKQLQASGGWNNANKEEGSWDGGDYAAFGAVNLFLEDGWRQNSPSKVNQAYGKLEWQGERASLALSGLGVTNKLVGNGTVPQELYREDPSAVFTSPDETNNKLFQLKLSGAFDVTDNFNVTGHVYQRNSNRYSNTGDVLDQETFSNADKDYYYMRTRLPGQGKGFTCIYADSNNDGMPDFYLLPQENEVQFYTDLGNGSFNKSLITLNPDLLLDTDPNKVHIPADVVSGFAKAFEGGLVDYFWNLDPGPTEHLPNGINTYMFRQLGSGGVSYFDSNTNKYSTLYIAPPVNNDTCYSESLSTKGNGKQVGMIPAYPRDPLGPSLTRNEIRDGAVSQRDGGSGVGVVDGTPTAIINKSNIKQNGNGAALQFNFNYDQHKFMFGGSIDRASASYLGTQRLAIMDNQRNVFSDPNQIGEEFYAAAHDIPINDFDGTSSTKSLYFSETWTPTQTLNLSFSGRYNQTRVKNALAPTKAERRLENGIFLNRWIDAMICPGGDPTKCPEKVDVPMSADRYWAIIGEPGQFNNLDKKAIEEFSYYSFNPSVGATWLAKPNLNLYANWNQGSRAPSVIELGCAFDGTLVEGLPGQFYPRSLIDGRGCTLPGSLSGDPYLPQVIARTMEVGARGKFNDFIEWNISAYRTDVKDDIYMTSVTSELNFFQDIGNTRRQGIEFGLAGEYGKSDFRMNYSLSEATFESYFKTVSPNNSSRGLNMSTPDYNMIQVHPGNVMPGVPFNNFNFNWGYKFTPKFKMNWSLVAHSRSFLRGNENNDHTPSPSREVTIDRIIGLKTQPNNYSGTAPGYSILNFNSRYDFGNGWATSVLINNVLNKTYYTAGRLGVNPIAPSTLGAIGPGGFNYNSSEWTPSQFISAGAPRGIWLALSYDFDGSKKSQLPVSNIAIPEPDRTLEEPTTLPTVEELALIKMLDNVKALPVLKFKQVKAHLATKTAEQEVKSRVETWRNALAVNDADAFVKSYSSTFAPAGLSHNKWEEDQKLKLMTNTTNAVEVSDLEVAAQGQRMVAVFVQKVSNQQAQVAVRKVLTFEQKEGQWQIIREHALPLGNVTSQPADEATPQQAQSKTSQLAPDLHKQIRNKPLKLSKADGLNYAEVK